MRARHAQIKQAFVEGIEAIALWYESGAVDCAETRANINRDLDALVKRVESHFHLRPIPLRLRVRIHDGFMTFRFEAPGLS